MKVLSYNDSVNLKNLSKCENALKELPIFVHLYFDAKKDTMSSKTLLGYIYDFSKFFSWARKTIFKDTGIISLGDFESVSEYDLNKYILFLQSDSESYNSNVTIRRKISSLNSLFSYLYMNGYIDKNPCKYIEYPDFIVPDSEYLSIESINEVMNKIKLGNDSYGDKQKVYIDKTRKRDTAIFLLLLYTGIRVAECVSLNIESVDIKNKVLKVDRGTIIKLPLSDVAVDMLQEYLNYRKAIKINDNALFLSLQNKRLCVQAIEDMLKKHGECLGLAYSFTPKVLRKTFTMEMYKVSANADMVNSYLGKKKVEDIRVLMNELTKEQKRDVYSILNQMYN